jgi:hypothetical protein
MELHSWQLHILYSSPDIIRHIKSRRMRWAGHAARTGETCTGFWWERPKKKHHLKDQGVDGRVGSKWTLERLAGGGGVEWIHLVQDRDRWQAVVNAVMNLRVLAPRSWLGDHPQVRKIHLLQVVLHSIPPPTSRPPNNPSTLWFTYHNSSRHFIVTQPLKVSRLSQPYGFRNWY